MIKKVCGFTDDMNVFHKSKYEAEQANKRYALNKAKGDLIRFFQGCQANKGYYFHEHITTRNLQQENCYQYYENDLTKDQSETIINYINLNFETFKEIIDRYIKNKQ